MTIQQGEPCYLSILSNPWALYKKYKAGRLSMPRPSSTPLMLAEDFQWNLNSLKLSLLYRQNFERVSGGGFKFSEIFFLLANQRNSHGECITSVWGETFDSRTCHEGYPYTSPKNQPKKWLFGLFVQTHRELLLEVSLNLNERDWCQIRCHV